MITGQQIRDARKRAGLSQAQLAELVGVVPRTIGGWERGENTPGINEQKLLAVLRDYLEEGGTPPLQSVSDVELLAEIARRFARAEQRERGGPSGDTAATITPAREPAPPQLRVAARDIGGPSTGQRRRKAIEDVGEEHQGEGPEGGA